MNVSTQNKTKPLPQQIQLHCICHNGGKVLHYFQRWGVYGPVYVCSACGAEKTVAA